MFSTPSTYCNRILKWLGTYLAKSAPTPMVDKINILVLKAVGSKVECAKASNCLYRPVVGDLLYLGTHTRPDIAFSVGAFSMFVESPSTVH